MQSSSLTKGCSNRRQQGGLAVRITRVLCPGKRRLLQPRVSKCPCNSICKGFAPSSLKTILALWLEKDSCGLFQTQFAVQTGKDPLCLASRTYGSLDSKQSLQSIMCKRKVHFRQHNNLAVWRTKCSCSLDIKRFLKSRLPKVLGVRLQIVLLVYILRVLAIQIARVHAVYIVKDSCGLAMNRFLLFRQQKVLLVKKAEGSFSLDLKMLQQSGLPDVLVLYYAKSSCHNSSDFKILALKFLSQLYKIPILFWRAAHLCVYSS